MSDDATQATLSACLACAAHDLRNPLSALRSTLEWLDVELAGRTDIREALHDATAATHRLTALIDDLAMLARIENAESSTTFARIDVNDFLEELNNANGATRSVTKSESLMILGDRETLRRAFAVLIERTGIRASSSGAPLPLPFALGATRSADRAWVEIVAAAPSAIGTDSSTLLFSTNQDALFRTFGMSFAKRVIAAHSGHLFVVATALSFAFRVRFPLA